MENAKRGHHAAAPDRIVGRLLAQPLGLGARVLGVQLEQPRGKDAGLVLRVSAEVLAQDAGLGDRVEGGVARAIDLAADDLVLAPVLELDPLDAARSHALGDVADECVVRLVEVVVGVEEGTLVDRHRHLLQVI